MLILYLGLLGFVMFMIAAGIVVDLTDARRRYERSAYADLNHAALAVQPGVGVGLAVEVNLLRNPRSPSGQSDSQRMVALVSPILERNLPYTPHEPVVEQQPSV